MKKTKKLDMWTVLSFVILLCYAVFLLYPMLNLLRQSVVTIDGAFTLEYFQKFFGKSYYLITLWNLQGVHCRHHHHADHRRAAGISVQYV